MIAVVLTVLGIGIGVYRFTGALDAVDTGSRFADGDTVTLRLDADSDKAIWIKDRGPSPAQKCTISGPGDPRLTDPGIDVFLTRDETWNPLRTIEVSRPGDHEITCTSEGPSLYAIGDRGGYVTLAVGVIAAVALPALGILIGTTVVAVTAFRRHAHRGRLLAERRVCSGGEDAHRPEADRVPKPVGSGSGSG
ncbi:hypothetical protein DEJ47_29725 [Streptomyces venezuelae]|uniref:Serine/arginine repetitive matrix protein 2 n=1 Tax=Streptomyces venezuelae TaxID=54571 RepID=A0A5P2BK24_STRVZ|nr:hypothetical protein DEJ47_29725 [Streptomyces venezuelae]